MAGSTSDVGTGAVSSGPDTYTMTEKFAPVGFDAEDAERATLFKANQSCVEKGRQFAQVTKSLSGNPANPHGPNEFILTFKCLLPSDPGVAAYPVPQPNQPPAQAMRHGASALGQSALPLPRLIVPMLPSSSAVGNSGSRVRLHTAFHFDVPRAQSSKKSPPGFPGGESSWAEKQKAFRRSDQDTWS